MVVKVYQRGPLFEASYPLKCSQLSVKLCVISKTLFCQYFHGTTGQPYILNPILIMKCIELFGFGLHLSSSVVSFPYLNCLPPQRSSSSPRGTKILEGSFQLLNKQIILIKSVAVTLFVSTVLTTTQKLPSQRICPSLSAFQNVTTDSAHSSYFNIADTYSLEHSGGLSSRTCHFLRFCPLDGCLSCPK